MQRSPVFVQCICGAVLMLMFTYIHRTDRYDLWFSDILFRSRNAFLQIDFVRLTFIRIAGYRVGLEIGKFVIKYRNILSI